MHGPLPPYGMIMEYKRLLEGAALPGSLNYQYIAANYFQLHSKCTRTFIYIYTIIIIIIIVTVTRATCIMYIRIYTYCSVTQDRKRGFIFLFFVTPSRPRHSSNE
jgi:hypothetical protein